MNLFDLEIPFLFYPFTTLIFLAFDRHDLDLAIIYNTLSFQIVSRLGFLRYIAFTISKHNEYLGMKQNLCSKKIEGLFII